MTDIPMNRKAAAARALYDVPLLCRRLPGTAPALAELVAAGAWWGGGFFLGGGGDGLGFRASPLTPQETDLEDYTDAWLFT